MVRLWRKALVCCAEEPPDQKQAAAAEVEITVMQLMLAPARRREAKMPSLEKCSVVSTVLDGAGARVCRSKLLGGGAQS